MILFNLIILLALQAAPAGTVRGTVTDKYDNKPVPHAGVVILPLGVTVPLPGQGYGGPVDRKGSFEMTGIVTGKYMFVVSSFGYVSYRDTISITESDQVLIKHVALEPALVESPPARELYHQKLAEENAIRPILTICLMGYTFNNGFLTVYPSFHNSSSMPVYVLRNFECIRPVTPMVKDSTGTLIRSNLIYIDCMGKSIPDSEDIIEIPPSQTIDYPPVSLELYDFNRLSAGKYSIWLNYKFHKRRILGSGNYRPDYGITYHSQIETLTIVLRGEFISSNSIVFENKP